MRLQIEKDIKKAIVAIVTGILGLLLLVTSLVLISFFLFHIYEMATPSQQTILWLLFLAALSFALLLYCYLTLQEILADVDRIDQVVRSKQEIKKAAWSPLAEELRSEHQRFLQEIGFR